MKMIAVALLAACGGMWLSTLWAVPDGAHSLSPPASVSVALPDAARQAVAELYPDTSVTEVTLERRILQFYEVTVVRDGHEHGVTVTANGAIIELEQRIDPAAAPDAVRHRLNTLAANGKLEEIERVEVRAEFAPALLAEPRIEYEADYRVNGSPREVRLTATGQTRDEQFDQE